MTIKLRISQYGWLKVINKSKYICDLCKKPLFITLKGIACLEEH